MKEGLTHVKNHMEDDITKDESVAKKTGRHYDINVSIDHLAGAVRQFIFRHNENIRI
jgi:NAD-dependent oxidoreductase involved in siderophore biosynthesis